MGSLYDLRNDHKQGTVDKPNGRIDFWMRNPPYVTEYFGMMCGICKRPIKGKHCLFCLPWKEEE